MAGMPDMSKMDPTNISAEQIKEMAENPMVKQMMSDPKAMQNYVDMIKSNPAMMEQMCKQQGITKEQLDQQLNTMTSMMGYYHTANSVCTNKLVQLSFVLIIIGLIYRYFF